MSQQIHPNVRPCKKNSPSQSQQASVIYKSHDSTDVCFTPLNLEETKHLISVVGTMLER